MTSCILFETQLELTIKTVVHQADNGLHQQSLDWTLRVLIYLIWPMLSVNRLVASTFRFRCEKTFCYRNKIGWMVYGLSVPAPSC